MQICSIFVTAFCSWLMLGTVLAEVQTELPLGNVFLTTEDISIPVTIDGDTVAWKVYDFWHKVMAEGIEKVEQDKIVLRVPKIAGYFLLHMEIRKDGQKIDDRYVPYAVIPPHEVRDKANNPFGVMTHFAQGWDVDILPLITKAGITSIRDEHYWAHLEKEKDVYRFSERSDRYMAARQECRVDPLFVMSFENKLYDDGNTPYTPEGCDAFARYGQAVLDRYKEQIKWVEVWNEYNGTWCEGTASEDRPRYYTQMLKHVYDHIKRSHPHVKILGCACVLTPIGYLEGIFKNGGLDYMDAVVLHPYRGMPEGVEEEVAEVEELIRKYNNGKDKPIWVTETGKYSHEEYDWEKGKGMEEKGRRWVARYLVRQYVLLLTRNVEKIYWYLMRDYHNFVTMGLVRKPDDPLGRYAVAPAYVAYATLIRQLDGAKYMRREAMRPYTRAYVQLFRSEDKEIRVCWATHSSEISIKTQDPINVVNIVGREETLIPETGKIILTIDEDPIYVKGKVQEVVEVNAGPAVLADSIFDYSKSQGKNNWFYGYYDGFGGDEGDGVKPSGPYTDDDFAQMKQVQTMWGYNWTGPAQYLKLDRNGGHPEIASDRQLWAVRRWRSTYSGMVRIEGSFKGGGNKGDGTEARVFVNGEQIFKTLAGGKSGRESSEFDLAVQIKEGSFVDFAITPGPPGSDQQYDASELSIRITVMELKKSNG